MLNKKIALYFPFSRKADELDDELRIVEGYAFVNEVVRGEGGIRLKRSAMEASTAAYLAEGTVRAMHQPIAAGKPIEVTWDKTGAFLRAFIADDQEWRKVKTGVYRGFSIGVNGKVTPGTMDVDECEWWDTSLVDRGKDPDAKFMAFRAEGAEENFTPDVVIDASTEVKRTDSFNDLVAQYQTQDDCDDALNYLWDVLYSLAWSEDEDKEAQASESIDQFKAYILPKIAASAIKKRSAPEPVIQRVEVQVEDVEAKQVLMRQVEESRTELSRVQGLLSHAEAEVVRLGNLPAKLNKPIVFADVAALDRTFAQHRDETEVELEKAAAELAELKATPIPVSDRDQDTRLANIQAKERYIKFLKG